MSNSDNDQAGVPLFEGMGDSSPPTTPHSTKRKREDSSKAGNKKRRKLKKPIDVDEGALNTELGVNHAIEHMDSRLMADHVAQRTKRFQPELSLIEAEDFHVPGMSPRIVHDVHA